MKLKNKVSLITGSSRGIGLGIAMRLAEEGSNLIINSENKNDVRKAVEKIKNSFPAIKVLGVTADISLENEVQRLYKESIDEFGVVNCLVNNAGITRDNLVLRMKEEEWDQVMNINLKSAFLVSKTFIRSMLKTGGRIIMMSSVVGVIGNLGQANYAASKGGMISLGKSLARELAGKNINVNMIAPGFIKTEMTEVLSEEVTKSLLASIPKKKFGEIRDIANLVAFLLSDESKYITGQVIGVNGGMVM